jgi:hypothetical protein
MSRHLRVVALLVSTLAANSTASAALLSVDFNDRGNTPSFTASSTQAGFSGWKMSGTSAASSALESQAVGAYTVTLQAFDDGLDENSVTAGIQNSTGQIDDRLRATPTNSGVLTTADLYDDVIFAGTSTGPTGGMDLKINGLSANTQYFVGLYTFDSGSNVAPQPRTANWLDGNSADALVLTTPFNGGTLPTFNDQYKFTGFATTDVSGTLYLKGRSTTPNATSGGVTVGVVINGFEISEVPEPASFLLLQIGAAALCFLKRR